MYKFHDTTDMTRPPDVLPSEALCLNGQFIEKMVPGYRTLYTTGREGNSREVSASESSGRDGARFRSVRREPREIRVGFQMDSRTARAAVDMFNALKKLVKDEECRMVFNDEPDKYFTGTLTDVEVNDPGELHVTGELVFYCSDPYKRAIRERTVTVSASNGEAVAEIEYQGTVAAYPTIRTTTESNTKALLFSDDSGRMITVGISDAKAAGLTWGSKKMAVNAEQMLDSENTLYPEYIDRNPFGDEGLPTPVRMPDGSQRIVEAGGTEFVSITPPATPIPDNVSIWDLEIIEEDSGEETLVGSSSEQEEEEVGEEAAPAVTGTTFVRDIGWSTGRNYVCRVRPLFYAEDFRETGYLYFGLNSNVIDGTTPEDYENDITRHLQFEEAEIILEKTGVGSSYATAIFCIFGSEVKRVRFRVDESNPVSGVDGYGIGINRFRTEVGAGTFKTVYTFILGEDEYEIDASSFTDPTGNTLDQTPWKAVFSIGRVQGGQQMAGLGFASAQLIATNWSSADQVADTMRNGDEVTVNCSTGDIRINGRPSPDMGSIDNDWTGFSLRPGFNRVECSANTMEANGRKPKSYTISYREAWE